MKAEKPVTVITGASSGIGRAASHAFARHGATVVLVARRERYLQDVAAECLKYGAREAVALAADVSEEQQVGRAARQAIEKFGRVDVWVNNAAVTLFGRFEEAPLEDFERVIRTNLFGYVYGARAMLPHFREQGRGLLINVSSVIGYLSQPYTSAYGISKAGIRSLGDSLRQELADAPHIHVCTVLPAAIDTPLFQMGANYTGRAVQPIKPVYPADKVARAILSLVRRPRREIAVGLSGRIGPWLQPFVPGLIERVMTRVIIRRHFQDEAAEPTAGNLYEPVDAWNSVSGGWSEEER